MVEPLRCDCCFVWPGPLAAILPIKFDQTKQNNAPNGPRQAKLCLQAYFLFVSRFYGPVNPMGPCRARSIYLATRLLGRLSPLILLAVNQYCAHSFARNWQLPFLNQRKRENDRRKYFIINLHERMLSTSAGVEPATSWSPVGRRIQLSHRGRPSIHKMHRFRFIPRMRKTWSKWLWSLYKALKSP